MSRGGGSRLTLRTPCSLTILHPYFPPDARRGRSDKSAGAGGAWVSTGGDRCLAFHPPYLLTTLRSYFPAGARRGVRRKGRRGAYLPGCSRFAFAPYFPASLPSYFPPPLRQGLRTNGSADAEALEPRFELHPVSLDTHLSRGDRNDEAEHERERSS
jgi:hypothetical protein